MGHRLEAVGSTAPVLVLPNDYFQYTLSGPTPDVCVNKIPKGFISTLKCKKPSVRPIVTEAGGTLNKEETKQRRQKNVLNLEERWQGVPWPVGMGVLERIEDR